MFSRRLGARLIIGVLGSTLLHIRWEFLPYLKLNWSVSVQYLYLHWLRTRGELSFSDFFQAIFGGLRRPVPDP